jgi:D-alanyl-D-alanine dipeptidase
VGRRIRLQRNWWHHPYQQQLLTVSRTRKRLRNGGNCHTSSSLGNDGCRASQPTSGRHLPHFQPSLGMASSASEWWHHVTIIATAVPAPIPTTARLFVPLDGWD